MLEQVMALMHGHPRAVSLLIDVIRRSGKGTEVPGALADLPDLASALLQRLVEQAPSPRHHAALQVSAHAPATTEPVLRAVLPATDDHEVAELWDWLCYLTFMEDTPAGVRPHDVARDLLEADLRWRDPEAYADIHVACADTSSRRFARRPAIPSACNTPRPSCFSSFVMIRCWARTGTGMRPGRASDNLEPDQARRIIAMTRARKVINRRAWPPTGYGCNQKRSGCSATPEGGVCGYAARLSLHLARPEESSSTPVRRRYGGTLSATVLPVPGSRSWPGDSTLTAIPMSTIPACRGPARGWRIADILSQPPTAWEFVRPIPTSSTGSRSSTTGDSSISPRPTTRSEHRYEELWLRLAPGRGGGVAGAYGGSGAG